jgi:dTDP-4-dehydrorhamnose 3,5-epimerase-like enzyme
MEVKEINFKNSSDSRGILTSVECDKCDVPINVKRIFYMHHVTENRGGHAHIDTDQVVIPIHGSFKIKVFDGVTSEIYNMCDCTKGLFIPRLTYTDLYDFSNDAVCLVLANTHYDMGKSLRSLDTYMSYLVKHNLL